MTPKQLVAYHKRGRKAATTRLAMHRLALARREQSGLVSLSAEAFIGRAIEAAHGRPALPQCRADQIAES
jgi:hypothetical protein